MRFSPATLLALTASVGLAGCSAAYVSSYKQTNHSFRPAPTKPKNVRVVKSRDDLDSEYTELGLYRGKAPTVKEAMATAKQMCADKGANLYILNTEPFASDGGFRVDGICAHSQSLAKKDKKK